MARISCVKNSECWLGYALVLLHYETRTQPYQNKEPLIRPTSTVRLFAVYTILPIAIVNEVDASIISLAKLFLRYIIHISSHIMKNVFTLENQKKSHEFWHGKCACELQGTTLSLMLKYIVVKLIPRKIGAIPFGEPSTRARHCMMKFF